MTRPKRIRVMYVVPALSVGGGYGGAERHVMTLMPNLDRSRFDAAVVCIGNDEEFVGDLAPSGTRAVALHRSKRQMLGALRDLTREMRNFMPDVVITRGYNAEMLGRIAAWLTRVPHNVVWVHNHGDIEPRGAVRRIADRVLDRVTSAYFGVASAQIDYMVNDLKYSPDKIRIIHNGVDPDGFEWTDERSAVSDLGIGESDKVVGIFAWLRPEKDHENFLRAARLVVDRVPNAKFLIVGDGPMRPEIERLVRQLELADCVVLTGPRSDVPDLLRAIDVFVLSSSTVECFPMCVAGGYGGRTAGGVYRSRRRTRDDRRTDDGLPGAFPRSRALADRLVRILSDSELAHQMGQAARVRVETLFSLRASVSATEDTLDALVCGTSLESAEHRNGSSSSLRSCAVGLHRRASPSAHDAIAALERFYVGTSSTPASVTASSRSGAVTTARKPSPSDQTLAFSVSPGNTTPANRAP